MKLSATNAKLLATRQSWAPPVAFIPTMGALHEGHLALIQQAREAVGSEGTVVVSIFVNPLQFDRPSDLADYPEPLAEDIAKCEAAGVDHLFHPASSDFYAADHSILVQEQRLARHLCGATRPGHFDGVCTVVLKLLNLVAPQYAVFGKKDYQQLAIIRRLVRDLALPVTVLAGETFRESDGLAMSSRNRNLTRTQRQDAPRLRRALIAARSLASTGERDPARYLAAARKQLEMGKEAIRIDYLEMVSRETLQPLASVDQLALLAVAAYYGEVRLIDNIEIDAA